MNIKVKCPKCNKVIVIKLEFGKCIADMIRNQHKHNNRRAK